MHTTLLCSYRCANISRAFRVEGLGQYDDLICPTPLGAYGTCFLQGMKAATTAAAELVLSEEETLLQRLIVEEAASVAAAMARSSARDLLETRRLVRDTLGPLGWLVLPDLPQELVAFTKVKV